MDIVVCIKRVPATDTAIKIAPDGKSIETSGVSFEMNAYDEFALEHPDFGWLFSLQLVTKAKLPFGIAAPGVDLALVGEDEGGAAQRNLKISNLHFLENLDTMWQVKFSEGTSSPDIKLVFGA